MLSGRAMYIWRLKNVVASGTVDDVVDQAIRAKISSLWVKIADGDRAFENIKGATGKVLQELVAKCDAKQIDVYGYHVPWCATSQAVNDEVQLLDKTVDAFKLAGVVVDNEDGGPYFKGNAQTAAQYGNGLRAAMTSAGKLVVMSSNDIVSAHPKSYAVIIGQSIDVNAPQVYYGQSKHGVSARLTAAMNENKKINKPFFPVGAAFLRNPSEDDGGFLDAQTCAAWTLDFIKLVSALHHSSPDDYPGYGFWNWEEAPDEVWQVLYSTDVFVGAAAQPAGGAPAAGVTASLFAMGGPTAAAAGPAGWTLAIERIRMEMRAGEGFARTVGRYSVLHDGIAQPGLSGMTVERQGPGDNGLVGKTEHRCIAAGAYPLRPHSTDNYATTNYLTNGDHPRPAIEVGQTGKRDAILVHPADRYGSTIGCINLSGRLDNADSDIVLSDSTTRVIAVIEDLRTFCGGTLRLNEDGSITGASLNVTETHVATPPVAGGGVGSLGGLVFAAAPGAAFAAALSAGPGATIAAAAALPAQDCLIYEQATGRMLIKENGTFDSLAVGYSGSLSKGGINDPSKQCVKGVGPIPRGLYTIGPPGPGPSPYSLRLTPDPANDMCGRDGFLIHGDSISHPRDASDGCIILNRPEREAIVKSGIKLLYVTDHISS